MDAKPLTRPLRIGEVELANRVFLAPLAGIGNWFVRLQARRFGAGLAFSEMVSSFALRYRNQRTHRELLRVHPDEGPLAIQLFGPDPDVIREAAAIVAETARPDLIDLNMGCPVPKVCKAGAGAALLGDPDRAVAITRAAAAGSGLPVTVKLRSGERPGERHGVDLAVRLVEEAGASAITLHPRSAATKHKGRADYALVRELAERVEVPVIVSGGLSSAERALRVYEESGADAVMIARGGLGNPWIFAELTGARGVSPPPGPAAPDAGPTRAEIVAELLWIVDRAEWHWGERAARNLRRLYPWYLERIGVGGPRAHAFQQADSLAEVRELLATLAGPAPVSAV